MHLFGVQNDRAEPFLFIICLLGIYNFALVLTHLLTLFVSALGKQKPSSGPHWNIKAIKNL